MSTLLADAVAELALEPGQTYATKIGDIEVSLRNSANHAKPEAPAEQSEEEPSQFADMVMLNIILNYPPSPTAFTVQARWAESPPPDPVVIDEWDRTPE